MLVVNLTIQHDVKEAKQTLKLAAGGEQLLSKICKINTQFILYVSYRKAGAQ